MFDFTQLPQELLPGAEELAKHFGVPAGSGARVLAEKAERLTVRKEGGNVIIGYSEKHEFFRGLAKAFAGKQCSETSAFSHLTLMADCSRNAVMNVETVKKLLRVLAAGGYDRLMLYIEDTYKVEGQPMFGYLRGAYTEEELKELDAYADSLGILLVPCMQTLAHLNAIFRWDDYASVRDCNDILLCGEERTYALIEDMFRQLSRSLNSREIHIGMDEAWMVGLGKYLDKHGYENRFDIINRHLARVLEIAEKYGYHCCMWGDMFYHLAFHGDYYRFDAEIPEEVRKQVPKNVDLVYWDYYHLDKKVYDGMLTGFQKFGNPVIFAGGAWRWTGFAPQNRFSLQASEQAIDSCIEHGVKNIICTAWGDNGGEASIFSVLPSVLYYGARRYGADVKADFADATGCRFDDFMTLELPDEVNRTPHKDYLANYSKVFLYNDLFLGIFDSAANPAYRDVFRTSLAKMKAAEKRAGDYRYVFSSLCALLDAVSEKYDLGVRIRAAYLAGDRAAAKELCAKIGLVIRKVKKFYALFSAQWHTDNKPNGFEVQDARLGGLIARLSACRKRLSDWADGKGDLPELKEERVYAAPEKNGELDGLLYNCWTATISACPV